MCVSLANQPIPQTIQPTRQSTNQPLIAVCLPTLLCAVRLSTTMGDNCVATTQARLLSWTMRGLQLQTWTTGTELWNRIWFSKVTQTDCQCLTGWLTVQHCNNVLQTVTTVLADWPNVADWLADCDLCRLTDWLTNSLIGTCCTLSLTQSPTHSVTHSITWSFTQSPAHSHNHSHFTTQLASCPLFSMV